MRIAFRLDDITADMDYAKFDRIRAMFHAAGVKPLIGVVPDPQDPKLHYREPDPGFWDLVHELQADGWVVSMHGLTHIYTTTSGGMLPLNRQSEFAGLPYEQQEDMIRKGREILASHGIDTDIFMAPSHSYDANTIKALLANGFTRMTDGFGTQPYTYKGMTFYPISFNRGKVLQNKAGAGCTTFVLHTNVMEESDFAYYERVLREQELMNYGDYLQVPAVPQTALGHAREYAMAAGKRFLVSLRK